MVKQWELLDEAERQLKENNGLNHELRRKLYGIIRQKTTWQLPDYDEVSDIIKNEELMNPFRLPEEDDQTAQEVNAPRADNLGVFTKTARQMIDARHEKICADFGITDENVKQMLYSFVEGQIKEGDEEWGRQFLDWQTQMCDDEERKNNGQPTDWTRKMRNWIAREKNRRYQGSHAGSKRKPPDSGRPVPPPTQD